MKRLRRIVFWCHLATGVTVGLVVLTLAATGVLMSFERQVVDWTDMRGLLDRDGVHRTAVLSPAELLATLPDSLGRISSLTWRSGVNEPVVAEIGRDRAVFLDPATGRILGEPDAGVRRFFDRVLGLHRWLAAPESDRGLGRSVSGVSNVALLFMVITGIFLWWPRSWKKAALRNTLLFRRGLSRKARRFNRHNVLGTWSALPLIVIAATGVLLSYPTAGDRVFGMYERMADERSVSGAGAAPHDPTGGQRIAAAEAASGLVTPADLLATAADRFPDWRRLTLERPGSTDDLVSFRVDRSTGGQPQKTAKLVLDRRSGAIIEVTPFAEESASTRFFEMIQYVHSGEAFGPAGQLVAGLVSLAAVFLVWTGLSLAWMRGRRSFRRRSR